jgi:hypothetical protein
MRKADKFQENELRIKIIETQIKNLKILIFPNPKHIYVSKGLVTNSYHHPPGGGGVMLKNSEQMREKKFKIE